MNNETSEKRFDDFLSDAFAEYVREEDEKLPSNDELKAMFPSEDAPRKKTLLPLRILKYAAMFVLAAMSVAFIILMSNGNVRAAISGAEVKRYDDYYVEINFRASNEESDYFNRRSTASIKPKYVPEGFSMIEDRFFDRWHVYRFFPDVVDDSNNHYPFGMTDEIIVEIFPTEDSYFFFPRTGFELERLTVNGMEAFLLFNERKNVGHLCFGDKKYAIHVYTSGISDKNEIIKIAEGIK